MARHNPNPPGGGDSASPPPENKLMFLIGELYRRLGEAKTAVKWFSRVVNDKKIVDAAMIRASRDMWQQVRNDHADNEIYEEQSAV